MKIKKQIDLSPEQNYCIKWLKGYKAAFLMSCCAWFFSGCGTPQKKAKNEEYYSHEILYAYNQSGDSVVQSIIRFVDSTKNNYVFEDYHVNGQLKSSVLYSGEALRKIYCVYDSSGKELYYGDVKDGSGHAVVYYDDGSKKEEGSYVNGFRNGWWKQYLWNGDIEDSVFYEDGKLDNFENLLINKY